MTPWKDPINHPSLTETGVHIWRANLDVTRLEMEQLTNILSADEIARANRFRFPEHKRRFIVARGILRQLLSSYLDTTPKSLYLTYGDQGKPQLNQSNLVQPLQFNISHSQDYALFSFTLDHLIGVDLEYLRQMPDAVKIAQRFFSPRESALISNLTPGKQTQVFFELWTAKEAYLKAIGTGLSGSLASIDIGLNLQAKPCLLAIKGDTEATNLWSIFPFTPATNCVATVAINTRITMQQINFWNWNWTQH